MGKQQDAILQKLKRLESLIISETGSNYSGQLKTAEENQQEYRKRLEAVQEGLNEVKKGLDTADVDGKLAKANLDASQKLSEVQRTISKEIDELKRKQIALEGEVGTRTSNIHRLLVKHFKDDPVALLLGGIVVALVFYICVDVKGGFADLKRAYEKVESNGHASQLLFMEKITSHEAKENDARRNYESVINVKFQTLESEMRDRFPKANK